MTRTRTWRLLHKPPLIAYVIGLGPLIGGRVLLLTSTGRRSGQQRVTPLQYEEVDDRFYIGSAKGMMADWVRNILANPAVTLRIGRRKLSGRAFVTDDIEQVIDFLLLRLERHPRMMSAILSRQGVISQPARDDLSIYASKIAVITVIPEQAR